MKLNTKQIEILLGIQGMTKTTWAERSGIQRQNIYAILKRGTCEPKTAAKLAKGLGADISEILAD